MRRYVVLASALVSLSALPALKMNGTPAHRRFLTNSTHVAKVGVFESFGTPSSVEGSGQNKHGSGEVEGKGWGRWREQTTRAPTFRWGVSWCPETPSASQATTRKHKTSKEQAGGKAFDHTYIN